MLLKVTDETSTTALVQHVKSRFLKRASTIVV